MLEKLVNYLDSWRGVLDAHPLLSVMVFAGLIVGMQLFMLPISPVALASGLFFGFWQGMLAVGIGCFAGATVNFFISRWVARDYVRRKLAGNRAFEMIDTAIAREGWRIIALLRLVPIPFGFANYCYGITPIAYVPYILATFVAILPANAFFVWMGSTFQGELATLVKGGARHPLQYVFLALGVVAAVVVLKIVAKTAKASVERTNDNPASSDAARM